jgi:hypothetical protein
MTRLFVCMQDTINSIFDTYTMVMMCTFDLCSPFDVQLRYSACY